MMQRYASYKDSGVEWLGEIPSHWEVVRAKRIFREVSEKNHQNAELLSVTQDQGVVPRDQREQRVVMPLGQLQTFKLVRADDFVISLRSFQGGIEYSSYTGLVSPAYTVLRKQQDVHSGYLKYLLKSAGFITELNTSVTGIRQGKNIDFAAMSYSHLPIPSKDEQSRIVNFLDQKTAEIDTAIAKKKRLIKLLQEQKRIAFDLIIYGLKSSDGSTPEITGNPFIPLVGAEISLVQLGRLCNKIADGPHFSPSYVEPHEGYLFLSAGNIRPNEFLLEDVKYVSERLFNEFSKRVRPEIGDVLYTKGGTTGVAKAVDLDLPFQVWVHIAVLKLRKDIVDPFYLAYVLNSTKCYEQSQLFTRGATNKDLGLTRMKNIYLPFISIEKQRKVVNQLDKLEFNYCKTESTIFREIELLQELKKCLISESVSGKIKV